MLPPLGGESRSRFLQALDRVSAFVDRLREAHAEQFACREGCDRCCRQTLQLRSVEAAYLLEGARALPSEAVSLIWRSLTERASPESCPLLQGASCLAYGHRPVVCRTHGLPMVRREGETAVFHCCPENFRDTELEGLAPSVVLDEERLALLMDAVDALYARQTGWGGGRIGIDQLLRAGLQG